MVVQPTDVKRTLLLLPLFLLLGLSVTRAEEQTSAEKTKTLFRQMGLPYYPANAVSLLPTGQVKFDDMFEAIAQAREYIHLDYFKFQEDSICKELFALLRRKAAEGVRVRVVYDSFGNRFSEHPLTARFLREQRSSGIQIAEFDRMRFPWVNHTFHRNHHKITIVDGRVAYSGGMNVADYYLHGKPRLGEWRDMHIRVQGDAVAGYVRVFAQMWYRATGEMLPPCDLRTESLCAEEDSCALFLADRIPRHTADIMRQLYISCIDSADSLVQIVNPYATLVRPVKKALLRALKRGVRVQIMVSARGDGPITPDVVGIEMLNLAKRGAEVYFYKGGFHHSKFMMIDSDFCTVGTTNLDARSLRYDYEVNAVIYDRDVTAQLQEIFCADATQRSTLLCDSTRRKLMPARRRISGSIFKVIKGVL